MKIYDLSIKKVLTSIIILLTITIPLIYFMFFAPLDVKSDFYYKYSRYRLIHKGGGFPLIAILYSFIYIIYLLKLITYKRKEVLIISKDSIKYSNPIYGDIDIPKYNINNIYVSCRNNSINKLKIHCKNFKLKNNIKTKFWNFWISVFIFDNTVFLDNIFVIPLNFLKYDNISEIESAILDLDPDTNEARKLMNDKLKKYKISEINQLKENTQALNECVIEMHKLKRVKQKEIALMLNISTYKVSKIIKNNPK